MAEDNIKDFSVAWITAGIIVFALLTFALTFTFNNNPSALGENEEQIQIIQGDLQDSLTEVETEMNIKTNSSAQLNSEDTALGTASASTTSYGFAKTSQDNWTIIKRMIAWVFAGTFGQVLIKFLSGIVTLVLLYYIIKLIRSLF